MISRIHSKLGTAGLVVAIVALVVALTGVAFAAAGLNSKQKKEVKKIAKQFAGKNGAPGATGPQGPKGDAGPAGKDGTNGAPGQSVTGAPIAAGGACGAQTGVKYTLGATPTNVCNGATGFTETLPSEKTETGAWAFGSTANDQPQYVPISYNIPLEAAPEVHVIQVNGLEKVLNPGFEEIEQPDCPGTPAEPLAEPGAACLYTKAEENVLVFRYPDLSSSFATGAVIGIVITSAGANARGTWAVTAP